VRSWKKFEEDCRVDGEITTHTHRPEGCEGTNSCKIGTGSTHHPKQSCNTYGEVKGPPTAKYIASEP